MPIDRMVSSPEPLPAASGMLVQPSRAATVCEVDRARKRAASCNRARTSDLGYRNSPRSLTHARMNTLLTQSSPCEACSAFTRVAARTLAPSPICDQLHRRLQPFRHLHDCSGCFRLERSPGGARTHWKAPPFHGARKQRSFRARAMGQIDVVGHPPWCRTKIFETRDNVPKKQASE